MAHENLSHAEERVKRGIYKLAIEVIREDLELARWLAAMGRKIGMERESASSAPYVAKLQKEWQKKAAGTRQRHGQLCDDKQGGKRGAPMGYSHLGWACPYFSYDAKRVVKCEAGRITFPDRQAEREHTHNFCAGENNEWKRCTLAAIMSDYYERANEAELEQRKKELGL